MDTDNGTTDVQPGRFRGYQEQFGSGPCVSRKKSKVRGVSPPDVNSEPDPQLRMDDDGAPVCER
jgi:hypothetical protein